MTPIEQKLVTILARGPIRGTAQVGYALWPDRAMQPQGAAAAAGGVLRRLLDRDEITSVLDNNLAFYQVTERGIAALAAARLAAIDSRQLTLID